MFTKHCAHSAPHRRNIRRLDALSILAAKNTVSKKVHLTVLSKPPGFLDKNIFFVKLPASSKLTPQKVYICHKKTPSSHKSQITKKRSHQSQKDAFLIIKTSFHEIYGSLGHRHHLVPASPLKLGAFKSIIRQNTKGETLQSGQVGGGEGVG